VRWARMPEWSQGQNGRDAIEKMLSEGLPNWDEGSDGTVDRVKILGNDAIVVLTSYSGVWHEAGNSTHITGRAAFDCVRVGDTWKIAVQVVSPSTSK
jgi:hypothetical protein